MITYRTNQSIFESESQVITNTVNCYGVMGKGIAQEDPEDPLATRRRKHHS